MDQDKKLHDIPSGMKQLDHELRVVRKRLSAHEPFEFVDFKDALHLMAHKFLFLAQALNTTELDRLKRHVRDVIREAKRQHGEAKSHWAKGYFKCRTFSFADARDQYAEVLDSLRSDFEFLMDYGRLEYNTGRLRSALEAHAQTP